jgi:hypothetical protein
MDVMDVRELKSSLIMFIVGATWLRLSKGHSLFVIWVNEYLENHLFIVFILIIGETFHPNGTSL